MKRRSPEILEALVAGVAWACLVVGLSFTALTSPGYMSTSSRLLGVARTSGLSAGDTAVLSERLRGFVAEQDPGTLPAFWRGEPAFDAGVVSHMEDVRRAIMGGRVATGVAAGLLAGYLCVCVALRRRRPLADSMRVGAWAIGFVGIGALAAGVFDFNALFSAFHGLFFASGTWTFPYDSLLIRLLPLRFWVAGGVSWSVLAGVGAVVLAAAAHHIGAAGGEEGSIRTAEDV